MAACEGLRRTGFVNYYGLQRFGKGGSKSHDIGRACLKENWQACIDMLFADRVGDQDVFVKAKRLYNEGLYAECLRAMPDRMYSEKMVVSKLAKEPKDLLGANDITIKYTLLLSSAEPRKRKKWPNYTSTFISSLILFSLSLVQAVMKAQSTTKQKKRAYTKQSITNSLFSLPLNHAVMNANLHHISRCLQRHAEKHAPYLRARVPVLHMEHGCHAAHRIVRHRSSSGRLGGSARCTRG